MYEGLYNFDEIEIKFYKDSTARLEAFKKGEFDYFPVNHSKVWATQLDGVKVNKYKWIKKETWRHQNNQGMQGFVFNLRKPLFQDRQVRKALALVYDFEWSNKTLFYGLYNRSESFFENSELAARGLPKGKEKQILEPFKEKLPSEVFKKPMGYLGKDQSIRRKLRQARKLLKEAGYKLENGVLTGPQGPLRFKILLRGPTFQRIVEPYISNLKKIGVDASFEVKEQSVWLRKVNQRDYDMIIHSYGQSQSPGNEQASYWGSKAAEVGYSRNYSGLKNEVVDELIEKVIQSESREELVLNTKALDRVLYHLHFVIPQHHSKYYRVAFWNRFAKPDELPPYYSPYLYFHAMWKDSKKAKALKEARKEDKPLSL
jgi:microcin C transport system substrate-binding protein